MTKTKRLAWIAMAAALMAALSPLSIPIGPIPISLGTLVIYCIGALLGPIEAVASVLIYLLLGLIGVPVFAGYRSGVASLIGPTGGFLIGYLPMVFIQSIMITKLKKKWIYPVSMVLSTIILYAIGVVWFLIMMRSRYTLEQAMSACVIPFLPGDSIKIVIATAVGFALRPVLDRMENGHLRHRKAAAVSEEPKPQEPAYRQEDRPEQK